MPINSNSYTALMISEQTLKDNSLLDENIDMKTITPTIRFVQEIYLTRLLGSVLYADLQDKISNSTLSSNEQFLMNAYITPYLIWKITQEAYPIITFKMKNKGVQVQSGEYSQAASMKDIQTLADRAGSNADWYADRLIKFLISNANLFPKYRQINKYDDVQAANRGFNSRIYLGGSSPYDYSNIPGGSSNTSGSL